MNEKEIQKTQERQHRTVLLDEAIDALAIKENGIYVDGTFGRGGHSRLILENLNQQGRLIAMDKDPTAIKVAEKKLEADPRVTIIHGSFADLHHKLAPLNIHGKVDGILLDLGVSSPQIDEASRGFSFLHDGPLDMRMDTTTGTDAATWINKTSASDMATVFKNYGEERFAKRIANAIVKARTEKSITKTLQLAEIISAANPAWEKHKHPATRCFQAIRIHINKELDELQQFLEQAIDMLAVGGRLVVISFHSLEDRMIKRFLRKQSTANIPKHIPVKASVLDAEIRMKLIGRAIKPSNDEIAENSRARSAVMRIGEKVS